MPPLMAPLSPRRHCLCLIVAAACAGCRYFPILLPPLTIFHYDAFHRRYAIFAIAAASIATLAITLLRCLLIRRAMLLAAAIAIAAADCRLRYAAAFSLLLIALLVAIIFYAAAIFAIMLAAMTPLPPL